MSCRSQWLMVPVLVLSLMSALGMAADAPAPAAAAAAKKELVEIPLAEIAPRAEESIRRLGEIDQSLAGDKVIETIESELAPLSERIEIWLQRSSLRIEYMTSVIDLTALVLTRQKYTVRLDGLKV